MILVLLIVFGLVYLTVCNSITGILKDTYELKDYDAGWRNPFKDQHEDDNWWFF